MTRYIVWIKESVRSPWEEQGEGPLTLKTAERIARELRKGCGCAAIIRPEGVDPREHFAAGKTIWNSDGTDGPVLICPPPKEEEV